jgi:hypothetical protein
MTSFPTLVYNLFVHTIQVTSEEEQMEMMEHEMPPGHDGKSVRLHGEDQTAPLQDSTDMLFLDSHAPIGEKAAPDPCLPLP